MELIKQIPEIFVRPFPHWRKVELFRTLLYAFLLLNTLSLLPVAQEAFGYHGIVGTRGWNTGVPWYAQGSRALLNLLSHPYNAGHPWIYQFFIGGQITFLITGLLRVLPKLSSVMVYFFTVNLFLKGYLMFTGGEVLVNLLLFYLIFIQQSGWAWRIKRADKVFFSPFQNVLNNTFYVILLLQICTLYLLSGLYKLTDEFWLSGDALTYISRIDAFSSGIMRWAFAEGTFLGKVGTYVALGYQLLFPVLVWVKPIKIPFLTIGIMLHLGIAFGMGIFAFGIIMILVYLLFLSEDQLKKSRLLKG